MKKKAVINKLVQARQKILNLIEPLSEKRWNRVFLGKWSLKDFVAHLIGWDIWGTKATQEIIQGKLPGYYKYYDKSWVTMNDRFVRRYKRGRKKDLLVAVKASHRKLVEGLENVSEELYNKDFGLHWYGSRVTLASDTLYQASDEEKHAKQIQQWLKTRQPKRKIIQILTHRIIR